MGAFRPSGQGIRAKRVGGKTEIKPNMSKVTLLAFAGFLVSAEGHADVDILGVWATENGKSHVDIQLCDDPLPDDQLCGKIIWLKDPTDDDGVPLVDKNNENPELATRPIIGLPLLSGFVKSDEAGVWEDGVIYNPEDGDTYKCTMTLMPDGTLKVRGYVGLPIFGKSQIWTRTQN